MSAERPGPPELSPQTLRMAAVLHAFAYVLPWEQVERVLNDAFGSDALAPLDASRFAEREIRWARELSRQSDAELFALVDARSSVPLAAAAGAIADADEALDKAIQLLETAESVEAIAKLVQDAAKRARALRAEVEEKRSKK